MYRGFLAAVGGAALVIAGLAGCSSNDEGSTAAEETTTEETVDETIVEEETTSPTATGEAAESAATVSIDGQEQDIQGTVVCTQTGESVMIAIGDATQGISATVSAGDEPQVSQVALGDVDGVALAFQEGVGQGEAAAEKDGDTYKITGTATGADLANPMEQVSKPFEIEVSCPSS
ncbi:lipoprotein LpqH [Mycolicibacterium thermoresistibile]